MKVTDFIGVKAIYDEYGQYIWAVDKDGGHQKLADLRGWGAIQNLFKTKKGLIDEEKAASFQDELGRWLVDAINGKLEREHTDSKKNETEQCTIPVVSTRIFRRGDKVEWRGMKLIVVEVGVGEVLIATSENVDDEDYNDWWVRNEYVC